MKRSWRMTLGVSLLVLLAAFPATAGVQVSAGPNGTQLSLAGTTFHTTRAAVSDLQVVNVPGSSTQLILWDEAQWDGTRVPHYGISLDGQAVQRVAASTHDIATRLGRFDPLIGLPMVAGLEADAAVNVYIVQFVTQPLPEFRTQIEDLGGIIRDYQPFHAYLVQMGPATRSVVTHLSYVRSITPYHPAYRLDETLLRTAPAPGQKEILPLQRYNILTFDPLFKLDVSARIRSIGGFVDQVDAGKRLVIATLDRAQLFEVARWDEVLFIDVWGPMEADMNNARQFGGANYIEQNAPAQYRGQGVRAEVFDAGFNPGHPDFASRPLISHGTTGSDSHGAATSGIVFGDGTGNAQARGMLPAGQGIIGDYNYIGLNGAGRRQHTAEEVQAPYFCVFETASVGDPRTFNYTTISAETDQDLFDFDIVHCQSQSNAGNQDSRPQAWAKNIVSGGGIYHMDTLSTADDAWNSGASTGPASDGRIKPDLCAYYDMILTTDLGSGYTTGFGGTSGATPIIAGHVGLFFQMWADGIFQNPVDPQGTVFDNRCHMTTAKAMMINNAWQYPIVAGQDETRMRQGWGWPSVQRMYDMRDKTFFVDETVVLQNLQSMVYVLNVEPGEPEFRATLCYADPPGNPNNQARHAVNAMKLTVTAPGGTIYKGNMGLKEANYSAPNPADPNWIDTVQNVLVQNPASGPWVIEILASEVTADGHVETPELDVDFALVVTGVTPCSAAGTISLDRSVYACSATATLRVIDCDLDLDPNAPDTVVVTIDSTSEPAGETVTLTETGLATASFAGTIVLDTTNAPGVLLVADSDTVTATYIDADNGQGGYNVTVTDTATVDCAPPTIADVQVSNVGAHTATVTFACNEPAKGKVYYGTDCGNLNQSTAAGSYDLNPMITLTGLMENTTYYFAVEAEDQAANATYDNNGGACYSFATPDIPEYFTQLFTADNDLDNLSLQFTPNGSQDFYAGCQEGITSLPTDPTGGTPLSLTDDSYVQVNLTGGAQVWLYGTAYTSAFVGSNGYITFGSGETVYTESYAAHFTKARVAALYDDLNPAVGGQVSYKQLADRLAVTWLNVPEYSTTNQNTFQIELLFSGQININFLAIAATDGLAGLSRGTGQPPDFEPSDLSALALCAEHPPTAVSNTVVVPVNTPTTVGLVAIDDGLPDPPGAMIFRILSLPTSGDLADPGAGPITSVPYDLVGYGNQVIYTGDPGFYALDSFTFLADDGGTPPSGGESNIATETLDVQYGPPVITTTALPNGCVGGNYSFQLEASPGQPPLAWSLVGVGNYVETDLGSSLFTEVGTARNWRADDTSWAYTLPFSFPYYGVNRTSVYVCSNGFLDFTSNSTSYSNSDAALKAAVRIGLIWDDLMTNQNATDDIYIDETVPGEVTIRWKGTTYVSPRPPVNFAVTLYSDGRIRFHYGAGNTLLTPTIGVSAGDNVNFTLSTYNNATSLTNANSHEFAVPPSMPAGLTVSASGLLAGVPTQAGTFQPRFKVTDALNRSDEETLTLVIDPDCPFTLGDMDCDGDVDFDDIGPFVLALQDPAGYQAAYPNCNWLNGDTDGDGDVDFDDINGFVALLGG